MCVESRRARPQHHAGVADHLVEVAGDLSRVRVAQKPGLAGWLMLAWAVGAAFVLTRLVAGVLRMRWVVRNAERVTEPTVLCLLDECGDRLNLRFRPLM